MPNGEYKKDRSEKRRVPDNPHHYMTTTTSTNGNQVHAHGADVPPYQPMGYWPVPNPPGIYKGRPLYSPSRTYSLSTGEGLPLPPDDITLPPFSTSMSGRQSQSLPQLTPQQKLAQQQQQGPPQEQQQELSQAPPQGPLHVPNNYGERPPPTPTNYYSGMAGPIMSNVHSPRNQMALVKGINMPYPPHQMSTPFYGHYPQQHQQNDRLFQCD